MLKILGTAVKTTILINAKFSQFTAQVKFNKILISKVNSFAISKLNASFIRRACLQESKSNPVC